MIQSLLLPSELMLLPLSHLNFPTEGIESNTCFQAYMNPSHCSSLQLVAMKNFES